MKDREKVSIEVRCEVICGLSNSEKFFRLQVTSKGQGQTLKPLKSKILKTAQDREKVSIEVRYEVMYGLSNSSNIFDLR